MNLENFPDGLSKDFLWKILLKYSCLFDKETLLPINVYVFNINITNLTVTFSEML